MVSKDTYLYNSDPLIGQWNKMQNVTNIQWQICKYFEHSYCFLYTYTHYFFILKAEKGLKYIIHFTWNWRTDILMQAWEKHTVEHTEWGLHLQGVNLNYQIQDKDSRHWLSTPK